MDVIWKQSATLQRVFPSGKNIYTTDDGQLLVEIESDPEEAIFEETASQ